MNSVKLLRTASIVLLALLCTSISFSQTKRMTKAEKEFDKYDFIDAREIYEDILEKDPSKGTAEIYKRLGDTYYYNGQYSKAVDSYKKLIEQFPDDAQPSYYFRAAQSLKSMKKYDEADKLMEAYIAKGGNGIIGRNFDNDRDYLNSIDEQRKDFIIEKVSVNSDASDFGPSFYLDKVVFASASNNAEGAKIHSWTGQPFLDLFVADMDAEGKLSNATALDGEINTIYHESSPVFTKDGRTAYFTRNNFTDGKKGRDKQKTIGLKIYKAIKSGDNFWTVVGPLPTAKKDSDVNAINSDNWNTAHPTLSVDETRLYFSSDRPGSIQSVENMALPEDERPKPNSDIWYVDLKPDSETGYGSPVNLGPTINTEARETFPFIGKDNTLYFSSDGRMGLGGLDVFETQLDERGKSGDIINFGEPVNSSKDDFGFILDNDLGFGYLSSNRDGEDGSRSDEIYRITLQCKITITGIVTDKETGLPLPGAQVTLFDDSSNILKQITVGDDAKYTFEDIAACETEYKIRGTKDRYESYEKLVVTPEKTGVIDVPIPLQPEGCEPGDIGCELCVRIYFDFDRYVIREDSWNLKELNKITTTMQLYPNIRVQIESHTDSRGTNAYNELLSTRRAQHTRDWIIENTKNDAVPITGDRIVAAGYGETQLLDRCVIYDECLRELGTDPNCSAEKAANPKCQDGTKCSEEEHQLNRRSKFIIIK